MTRMMDLNLKRQQGDGSMDKKAPERCYPVFCLHKELRPVPGIPGHPMGSPTGYSTHRTTTRCPERKPTKCAAYMELKRRHMYWAAVHAVQLTYRQTPPPDCAAVLSLLLTFKTIQSEAAAIFYRHNQFVFNRRTVSNQ